MNISDIRKGLAVYLGDRRLGTVENVRDNQAYIGGRAYPLNAFSRFENNRLYLADTYQSAGTATDQNQISVPVVEEQLKVGKREVSAGEVQVNKRVIEEQQSIPVELRREEVRIEERDLPDRPLRAGEVNAAFQEGTIRVPVMAEEAVVAKEARVTGEVVLNKNVQTEKQQISDTVRKEQVEVVRDHQGAQAGARRDTTTQNYATSKDAATTRSAAPVRPMSNDVATSSTASATSGNAHGQQLQKGMKVYGADQESVGQVKEVRSQDFLIDRPMARDVYAPYSAIQTVTGSQVVLNIPASEAGSQGWSHPSLGGGDSATAY